MSRLFSKVTGKWDCVDVLLDNAELNRETVLLDEVTAADWQTVIDTHLTGFVYLRWNRSGL